MSSEDVVLYEVRDKISIITLNRPKVHACNLDVMKSLNEKLEMADDDENTTCVLLKSSGNRVFCAGIDIRNVPEDPQEKESYLNEVKVWGRKNNEKIMLMKKPVVCQVQGSAVGYGMELIMVSDLRIIADRPIEEMFFSMPEIDVKVYAQTGATIAPLLAFGLSFAKRILLTADKFGLDELKNLEFPTRIYSMEDLEEKTLEFCMKLSNRPRSFLSLFKTTLTLMNNKLISKCFDLEDECGIKSGELTSNKELDEYIKKLFKEY